MSATSRSTGRPENRAPSGSEAIACSARPWRVRSSVQAAAAARRAAKPITKNERTWMLAPATETTPSRPTSSKGSGSGKTYAGRVKTAPTIPWRANAIASVAATQPSVEPRRRYGSMKRMYVAAADTDAQEEPDDQGEQEPPGRQARLADRRGAGGDEQRREDRERDEVAEGEVDDPRQAVDQRVTDGEDAVDPACRETGDDDLDDEAHGRTLLRRHALKASGR